MDRRWLLVPLVLLAGLLVAWVVTMTPDVGRSGRERGARPAPVAVSETPEAPAPEVVPEGRRPAEQVLVRDDKRYRLDPNFGKGGRDDTPETAAAAKAQQHLQKVIQGLSDQANGVPEATGLEIEVVALYDELVFFREEPEGKDWLALSQKAMRLQEKIRNVESLTDDADLHDALDGVKSSLVGVQGQGGPQGP